MTDRYTARQFTGFIYYTTKRRFEEVRKLLGGKDRVGLELVNSSGYMQRFEREHGPLEKFDGVSRFGYRTMPKYSPNKRHEKKLPAQEGRKMLNLDHDMIVFYAWRKLRHAISGPLDPFRYLGVPFLGETFRFSDLKAFNDVVRGEITQRDAFKRTVMNRDFVTESNIIDKSRRGKPTNLWTVSAPIREYLESAPDETQEEL